jgi:hypothetical protein
MLLPVAGQLFWKDHVRYRLIALVSSGQALVFTWKSSGLAQVFTWKSSGQVQTNCIEKPKSGTGSMPWKGSWKVQVSCPGKAPSTYSFISQSRKGEFINLEEYLI